MSGWSSRFTPWGGRFSPFGRSSSPANGQVSDSDFSYITSEDLAKHTASTKDSANATTSRNGSSTPPLSCDTDVLILKHRKVSYPIHFPEHSIDDGTLTLGSIRVAAAKKLQVGDERRIKLFHKGKNLKQDSLPARDAGLRSSVESEILCVVGENPVHDGAGPESNRSWSVGEDEEDDTEDYEDSQDGTRSATGDGQKKKRTRKRKSKKKKSKGGVDSPSSDTRSFTPVAEHLPLPTGAVPRPGSASNSKPGTRGTSPSPASNAPQTALQKLDSLASNFHTTLVPPCIKFLNSPPSDKTKRDFEHKKLSETVLAQVLLKLDAVETEGDPEARMRRKELVREVQGMLNRLDEVVK